VEEQLHGHSPNTLTTAQPEISKIGHFSEKLYHGKIFCLFSGNAATYTHNVAVMAAA